MTKKQKWLVILSAVVLVALVVGALFLWKGFSAEPEKGEKTFTFKIVTVDRNELEFTIRTKEDYLGKALEVAKIVEYEKSGLYTTIGGFTADYEKDGAYWWLTCNGEEMQVGMNDQPIKDGDAYVATYTVSE